MLELGVHHVVDPYRDGGLAKLSVFTGGAEASRSIECPGVAISDSNSLERSFGPVATPVASDLIYPLTVRRA